MAEQKSLSELTKEFESKSNEEQMKILFQLLMSIIDNIDKGFNQMGTNQQQFVEFTNQGLKNVMKSQSVIIKTLAEVQKKRIRQSGVIANPNLKFTD